MILSKTRIERNLKILGLPCPADSAEDARIAGDILSRLLFTQEISISDILLSRDIIERLHIQNPAVYIFLSAMFISWKHGNVYMQEEDIPALIRNGGYLDAEVQHEYSSNSDYMKTAGDFIREKVFPMLEDIQKLCSGKNDAIVFQPEGGKWYFQKNRNHIHDVNQWFSERFSCVSESDEQKTISAEDIAPYVQYKNFSLQKEQKDAVYKAVTRKVTVITGGPGTGKTTIICSILRFFLANGMDICDIYLTAPTGRAAQRMGESLQNQCRDLDNLKEQNVKSVIGQLSGITIHELLGGYKNKYSAQNPLSAKQVIVDEASMISLELMTRLLQALPDQCRLILIGDRDQLPSVDAGAVLGDIVKNENTRPGIAALTESRRFTGNLKECALAVNTGDTDKLLLSVKKLNRNTENWIQYFQEKNGENELYFYDCEGMYSPENLQTQLKKWICNFGFSDGGKLISLVKNFPLDDLSLIENINTERSRELFAALNQSRILSVVRNGPFGVHGINEYLFRYCRGYGNYMNKSGVPIIIMKNDRSHHLYNGDIGITVRTKDGITVMFPRGEKVVCCPVTLLPEHELAYAITIHKSQGSEFDNVFVALPDDVNNPLLARSLIYTGITRAKKRAVILGTHSVLETALKHVVERHTGIDI